jgi:hypothetical protein
MQYFDFYPKNGHSLWDAGAWSKSLTLPSDFTQNAFVHTTPEQDLVILNAFNLSRADPPFYSICGFECQRRIGQVLNDALGPKGFNFNPVDPYTGNIYDAQWNWVGWEDPNTGNIYDSNRNWAGWNPNYQQNFTGTNGSGSGGPAGGPATGVFGAPGSAPWAGNFGTTSGPPGPSGFGWWGDFAPVEEIGGKKPQQF